MRSMLDLFSNNQIPHNLLRLLFTTTQVIKICLVTCRVNFRALFIYGHDQLGKPENPMLRVHSQLDIVERLPN